MNQPNGAHFFDRYDRFIGTMRAAGGPGAGAAELARMRHRYDAIVANNRDLFRGAKVLDIKSANGFWSLAALDAGAARVVGLEAARKPFEAAKQTLAELPFNPSSYEFVNTEIPPGLRALEAGAFDLVLCHGFLEQSDPRFLFQQLSRLHPKHVILDTRVVQGKGPIIRLMPRNPDAPKPKPADRYNSILSLPNHELIAFFCEFFQFRWRLVDWHTLGIVDWTGVNDYQRDRHSTYVLENIATNPAREGAPANPARRRQKPGARAGMGAGAAAAQAR